MKASLETHLNSSSFTGSASNVAASLGGNSGSAWARLASAASRLYPLLVIEQERKSRIGSVAYGGRYGIHSSPLCNSRNPRVVPEAASAGADVPVRAAAVDVA